MFINTLSRKLMPNFNFIQSSLDITNKKFISICPLISKNTFSINFLIIPDKDIDIIKFVRRFQNFIGGILT